MDEITINELFTKFREAEILVLGDVMIDYYVYGRVTRLSPEAPVPIVNVQKRDYRLGGAANVALNLKSLGANPILCSIIGDDDKANMFSNLMFDSDLDTAGLIRMPDRKTTVKYRIIGNNTQIARIDDEIDTTLKESEQEKFIFIVENLLESRHFDAIIFEDYDKGLFTETVIQKIVKIAKQKNIFTAVDPKKRNFNNYTNVDFFKPNLHELINGLNIQEHDTLSLDEIHDLSMKFASQNNIKNVMITLSERGLTLYNLDDDKFYHYQAFQRHVSDVSGAGDTVISVATLCLISGFNIEIAAQTANLAGGIVCEHVGVKPIDPDKLKMEMLQNIRTE